ncbi:MAG: DUF1330 domain-containing protein [Betaproteobacteria bacterium]
MAAYLISTIEVTDPVGYEEYRKMVGAPLAKFGGKFIVRGGAVHYAEGEWQPKRVVVVEFADMGQARAFYDSPEYTEAIKVRQRNSIGSVILVEGL